MAPIKAKFITYYRVSTQKQGRSGLGLEAQKAAVDVHLRTHGGRELASYIEVESGKNAVDRPQLQAALLRCRQTRATLLVAKLDRLSRNASFLMNLKDSGVQFEALDIPGANPLTVGVMALMAQQEREFISTRTKAALAARKARGLPLGNPRDLSPYAARASARSCAVRSARARAWAKDTAAPAFAAARVEGCNSLRSIANYLNEREVLTPRGKRWTATAVRNAQQLLDA